MISRPPVSPGWVCIIKNRQHQRNLRRLTTKGVQLTPKTKPKYPRPGEGAAQSWGMASGSQHPWPEVENRHWFHHGFCKMWWARTNGFGRAVSERYSLGDIEWFWWSKQIRTVYAFDSKSCNPHSEYHHFPHYNCIPDSHAIFDKSQISTLSCIPSMHRFKQPGGKSICRGAKRAADPKIWADHFLLIASRSWDRCRTERPFRWKTPWFTIVWPGIWGLTSLFKTLERVSHSKIGLKSRFSLSPTKKKQEEVHLNVQMPIPHQQRNQCASRLQSSHHNGQQQG